MPVTQCWATCAPPSSPKNCTTQRTSENMRQSSRIFGYHWTSFNPNGQGSTKLLAGLVKFALRSADCELDCDPCSIRIRPTLGRARPKVRRSGQEAFRNHHRSAAEGTLIYCGEEVLLLRRSNVEVPQRFLRAHRDGRQSGQGWSRSNEHRLGLGTPPMGARWTTGRGLMEAWIAHGIPTAGKWHRIPRARLPAGKCHRKPLRPDWAHRFGQSLVLAEVVEQSLRR